MTLTSVGPVNVWVGLTNSDDVGIRFDLRAEVYRNTTALLGSGELPSVAGGSSGFNNAHQQTIALTLVSGAALANGDALSLKLFVRNACINSGKNSGRMRLWFDDAAANSRVDANAGGASTYYLHNGFVLNTTIGAGPKQTVDTQAGAKCSPYTAVGAWSGTAVVISTGDTTPPTVTIAQPADGLSTNATTLTVSGSVSDESAVTVSVNGVAATVSGAIPNRTYTATVPLGTGPAVSIQAVATDAAGNSSQTSVTVHVDRAAPALQVTVPAAGGFFRGPTLAVLGTVTDASATTVSVNSVAATVTASSFTASIPVTDGPLTIHTIATDAAGNTSAADTAVTIDSLAPAVQITAPAAGAYVKGPSLAVAGTVSDATTTSVVVNGVAATIAGTAFSASIPSADGALTIAATATDAAGNQTTATVAVTVDSVAPMVAITAPAATLITSQASVHVTGTVSDPSPVTLTSGGATVPVAAGAFAFDAPLGSDGPNTIAAVATDAAGNTATASVTVVVDRTAPTVQLTSPAADGFFKGPTLAVSGTVTDASATTVSVNGVAASLVGSGFSRTFAATLSVTDGPLTIQALATDAAGNTSTASTTVTIDSVAPTITIVTPADGQYTAATALDVAGGVTDGSIASVTVNGVVATLTGSGSSRSFAASVPIGNGPTVPIQVVATDTAGNTATATVTVRVDRVAPVVQIASPTANTFRRGPIVPVTGTVTDESPSLVEVNGELAQLSGVASGFSRTFTADVPAADGPFTITATAHDAAGNTSAVAVSITVDSVPPVITVASPAPGAVTNQSTIQISGSVADSSPVTLAMGPLLVPLNGGVFTTVATLAPEGARTVTLTATDAAGNQSAFDVHVTLDQTPPTLTIEAPPAGAILGSLPVAVQGFVYDATDTTVTVNGVAASRLQDAWNAAVSSLGEGRQTLTVVATDAAGNTQTLARDIVVDLGAPVISIAAPIPGTLTNAAAIEVRGTASDTTLTSVVINGVAASLVASGLSRTFTATVPLADGDNHLVAVATDALNRTGQAEVVVTRDSTPPVVSIDAPETIARLRGATATISASDNVGLAQVTTTLNGSPFGSFATAPFTIDLAVPAAATIGDVLIVTAIATDRAGNTATASRSLRVIADGVVVGQVLSDVTGLPLSGAAVVAQGFGPASDVASGFSRTTTSDARGGYSLPASDATVLVSIARDGMTSVERQVPVQEKVGTAVVDARLTPIATPTTLGPDGGTLAGMAQGFSPAITVTIPSGALASPTPLALTPLSPQGLPALLPLGWSPIAAFDLRDSSGGVQGFSPAVSVVARDLSPAVMALLSGAALVIYRASTHGWFVVSPTVSIANAQASFTIPGAGAYALVVADVTDPPLAMPGVDQPLTGVAMTPLPSTATATGTVSPATLPPSGGTATGALAIQSPTPLPSGTVVQAQVTETFGLINGQTASEEQRTEDIVLYRIPAAPIATNPQSPIPNPAALSAFFPITPSRTYQTTALATGTVHLDILAGRESVRGQTGGSEPVTIDAGGGVTLTVPARALPRDTAVRVQPAILSSFLPGATPNSAPPDVVPVGEVVVDFASQTLALGAELTVPAGSVTASDTLLVARVVRLDGIPRLLVVARGELVGDKIVSHSVAGLEGITQSGRHVFYKLNGAVGFVAGTLSASGSPVAGFIDTNSLPFIGVSSADGHFIVATRAADVSLTGHVVGTPLQGRASVTVVAGQTAARDVLLAGAVTTATVTPADGATLVERTAQIEVAATAALSAASVAGATLTLTANPQSPTPTPVALRTVLSGSGQVLAIVPATTLDAATTYHLTVLGLSDVYGAAVSVAAVTFTTRAEAPATYDPRKVVVSTPDNNGIAHVTAAAGTVPPGTQILVVNAGSGAVASFTADNDGALNGEVSATVEDRLIVTITDPTGAVTSFERGAYVAPNGSTVVNSGGGRVTAPGQASVVAGAELLIPADALDAAATFSLTSVDLAALFPEEPLAASLINTAIQGRTTALGPSVKITGPMGKPLKSEAKLAFEKPGDAPDNAGYVVYRRLQGPNGMVAYETLDEAAIDPQTGKLVTASPPYPGWRELLPGYDPAGLGVGTFTVGNLLDQYAFVMWVADQVGGHPLPGRITGTVFRAQFAPGATAPTYVPVPRALVSAARIDGVPLFADQSGTKVAVSQADGTFVLLDPFYTGGQILLSATLDGQRVTATAYEANPQDYKSPTKGFYKNVATANLTFPASVPRVTSVDLQVVPFVDANGTRTPAGLVTVGTPVQVAITTSSNVNGLPAAAVGNAPATVTADVALGAGHFLLAQPIATAQPGAVLVTVSAKSADGGETAKTVSFRVVAPGGTTREALPNDSPAVIEALTVPKRNATGVQPTVLPQVSFTEPVTHISTTSVRLTDATGTVIPVSILGAGLTGPVDNPDLNAVVTGLTLQPTRPLEYGTTYTLQLTADIRDTDVDPVTGEPMGKPLIPYTTTFTTFNPTLVGQTTDAFTGGGLAVIDDRAYVAQNIGAQTTLRLFDVSDPTNPTEIAPNVATGRLIASPPVTNVGHPADLQVQDQSPVLSGGRLLALGLTNLALPYHPSNLLLYDVTSDQSWRWIGAVTLGTDPLDGMVRRIRLKNGVVYAATTGIGKGIQVIDVNTALASFARATADGESSPAYFDMQRRLALDGQGFGQEAIVQTIFVPSPGLMNNSQVWDLDVLDLTLGGLTQPVVVATGRAGLTIANPVTGALLWNTPTDATGVPIMGWGFEIAAAVVNGRPLAAILAAGPGPGSGVGTFVIIVDLTDPTQPRALGRVPITGVTPGVRADLVIQGDRVYVGGDTATTVISLTDPAHPEVLGTIQGVAGRLSFTQRNLLFSNVAGTFDQVSAVGGVRSTALGSATVIRRVTPALIANGASTSVSDRAVQIDVAMMPPGAVIAAAHVDIYRDNQLVESLPATTAGSTATAVWPANREVTRGARYTAAAVVTSDDPDPLQSPPAYVPLIDLVFVDKRGEETFAPLMSDPRPVVTFGVASFADVRPTGDGTQADVHVSGTVTDAVADIVPNHTADIAQVTVNGVSIPVTAYAETPTAARPYPFRGRFDGVVTVNFHDGANTIRAEVVNAVQNYGYDNITIDVEQPAVAAPPPSSSGTLHDTKSLDPFTMIVSPMSPDRVDSIVLYHSAAAPTGNEPVLLETGPSTGVFTAITPDLGETTVTFDTPFVNDPLNEDTLRVRVTSSTLVMVDDQLDFLESGSSSSVFRTPALRLPNNESLEVRVINPFTPTTVDTVRVRSGARTDQEASVLSERTADSQIFTGQMADLGNVVVYVRSIQSNDNAAGTMLIGLNSSTLNLSGLYVKLTESVPGSGRYITEPYDIAAVVDTTPPPPPATKIVGIHNAEPSSAGTLEPLWVIVRGLRSAGVGDTATFDGDALDLTTAPLPVPVPPRARAVPRAVHLATPVVFVDTDLQAPAKAVKNAKTATPHTFEVSLARLGLKLTRRFSSVTLSKRVVLRGLRSRIDARFMLESAGAPELQGVCAGTDDVDPCSATDVTIAMRSSLSAAVPGVAAIAATLSVTVAKNVAVGSRPLTFLFKDGTKKRFPEAIEVQPAHLVVLAVDGLSKDLFDEAVATPASNGVPAVLGKDPDFKTPRTGLNYVFFNKPEQAVIATESTTFPPITFTRWTTVFSGSTPSETLVPALQWLNRQAFVTSESEAGAIEQGIGSSDRQLAKFVGDDPRAFNRHPQKAFIYNTLRENHLQSGVFLQQAGLGLPPLLNDVWRTIDFTLEATVVGGAITDSTGLLDPSGVATALDDSAIRFAFEGWDEHSFDLSVIYLAGLDHYVHLRGVAAGRTYFNRYLHARINLIVQALDRRKMLDRTVFAVFADHGHIDADIGKYVSMDQAGFLLNPARRVLDRVGGNIRVGERYSEGNGRHPNVIFVPQFGMANIYVAGNVSTGAEPDWRKPASVADLKPLVDQLVTGYMKNPLKVVDRILVRVPGPGGTFEGSAYWVVADTYKTQGHACGPSGIDQCTLGNQLVELRTLNGQALNGRPGWEFSNPEDRITKSISINSGDLVLLANLADGFQFGFPFRAQHGSLTFKDSVVPVAFGFPRASGAMNEDDGLRPVLELLSGTGVIATPVETPAMERFFLRP